MADPRLYQIAVLSALLVYGMAWLDFEITAGAPRCCWRRSSPPRPSATGSRAAAGRTARAR